jgi:hypothetical protein
MKEELNLDKLKKDYSEIQRRYDLPSFEELNKDFVIEKISEVETDFLIREIRKFIGDKLANYMRFIENLLNPVNVPLFVFSMVKVLDPEDKNKLNDIYKRLIRSEIKFIERDVEFSEEKEVIFIKESYTLWQEIKKDISRILEKIESKLDIKLEINNKGYFG